MHKGQKNKDGKFPPEGYSKISSGSSTVIRALLLMTRSSGRGGEDGFLPLVCCCSFAVCSSISPREMSVPQWLKNQVWRDEEMFKPNLGVVTAQNVSATSPQVSDNVTGRSTGVCPTHLYPYAGERRAVRDPPPVADRVSRPVWDRGGSNIVVSARWERRRRERSVFKQVQKLAEDKPLSQVMKTDQFLAVFKGVFPP